MGTGSGFVGLVLSGEGVEGVTMGAPGTGWGVDFELRRVGNSGN